MSAVDKQVASAVLNLGELSRRLDGKLENGDPSMPITGFATLGHAGPRDISFIAAEKMLPLAAESSAGAFVVAGGLAIADRPVIRVSEIWEAVCRLIAVYKTIPPVAQGIHPTAVLSSQTVLGKDVALGAYVVIGDRCRIGERTQIGAGCTIGDDTIIGDDCIIHPGVHIRHEIQVGSRVIMQSGAVIGGDGFKFEFVNGAWKKIPQVGTVIIEDDVEIGANSTVDRAFLDETRVGKGVKIDNLCQVAHNVQVGANSLLCAYVGISGSVKIGENCILAGKVGIKDGVTIGNGVQAAATAAIKDSIPDGQIIIGQPAIPIGEWSRMYAAFRKGPEVLKRLKTAEGKLDKMEKKD